MSSLTPTCRALLAAACLALGSVSPLAMADGGPSTSPTSGTSTDAAMPGELLVKLRSSAALAPLLAKYPLSLVSRFGARPIYRLKAIGGARTDKLLAALLAEPVVMLAETNLSHRSPEARRNIAWAIGTPDAYTAQWAPQAMRLAEAHRLSTGAGVRIAVLDTGVDASHPLLAGRLLPGFDFVDDDNDPSEPAAPGGAGFGHGTHVAGLLAMAAPGARIMPLRVLDADGVGNAWVLADALLYAVDPDGNPATDDGVDVISLSLGSLGRTRLFDAIVNIASCGGSISGDAVADLSDPGYADDHARCAARRGVVVVVAAGNGGNSSEKQYPAAEGRSGLLAVAASNAAGRLAGFSNYGSWIGLAAPGEGITSAQPGGGYATWSGTSMAAPLAAGTAALVRALNPDMKPDDVVKRLRQASAGLCGNSMRRLDAAAAVTNTVPPQALCP